MIDDSDIDALRQQVFVLAGKCVWNFQRYESRLKRFLTLVGGRVKLETPDSAPMITQPDTTRMTLGTLTGELFREYFADGTNKSDTDNGKGDELIGSFAITIELDPEQRRRLMDDHAEFVTDRNNFIHHFADQFCLDDILSCRKAKSHLEALREKTLEFDQRLDRHIGHVVQVRKELGLILADNDLFDKLDGLLDRN